MGDDEELTGSTLLKYYHIPGLPVLGTIVGVTRTYLASDGLGSETVDLSYNGSVLATALYGPYGVGRYATGTMPSSQGYTGQRQDSGSGLDYYSARYYDASVGQFSSADTVQGPNRYGYVGGNPETANDPTGQRRCDDSGACGSDGGGAETPTPTCDSPQSCAGPVPGPCANSGSPQCHPMSGSPCDGPCGDTNQDGVVQPTFGEGAPGCVNYMCQVGHNHRGILGSLGAGKFGDATTVIINLDGTAPDGNNDLAFVDAQLQEIQKNGDAYFDNLKTSGDLIATGAGASPLVADVLKALLTKSKGVPVLGSGAALVGLVGGIARHIAVQNQENAFNAMIASDRQTINNYAFGGVNERYDGHAD